MEKDWSAFRFVDDRTFILGSEEALYQYLDRGPARQDGPLQAALRTAAEKHHVVAGFNPAVLPLWLDRPGKCAARGKAGKPDLSDLLQNLPPLLQASCMTAIVHVDKDTQVRLRLDFANEQQAEDAAKAGHALLKTAADIVHYAAKDVEDQMKLPRASRTFGRPDAGQEPRRCTRTPSICLQMSCSS